MDEAGAEVFKRFDKGKYAVLSRLSPVGVLCDMGCIMWDSSLFLLIWTSTRVLYPALPYSLLWLGVLLCLDAKLLYLTNFPPEFFHRRNFWSERFAMMVSAALLEAGLLYFVYLGWPRHPWTEALPMLLHSSSPLPPAIAFNWKLKKELQNHPEKDAIAEGFYRLSFIGRALFRLGLGSTMKRSFLGQGIRIFKKDRDLRERRLTLKD